MLRRRRTKSNGTKRPVAVTVIAAAMAVLFLVRLNRAIIPLLEQDILSGGLSGPLLAGGALTATGWTLLTSAVYLLLVIALVLVLIGFLRLRRWSWVVLMVWTGLSLSLAILQYFYGQPNYLVMASDVVIALALAQSDVQKAFGIRTTSALPL
jgi:hypothetical protein